MQNSKALPPDVSSGNGQVDKQWSCSWNHGGWEVGAGHQDPQPVIQRQGGPSHPTLPMTEVRFLELNPNV